MKNKFIQKLATLLIATIPVCCFAQAPGPGNGGADAVPFDDNMNLLFLAVGIVFAVIITAKNFRKIKNVR